MTGPYRNELIAAHAELDNLRRELGEKDKEIKRLKDELIVTEVLLSINEVGVEKALRGRCPGFVERVVTKWRNFWIRRAEETRASRLTRWYRRRLRLRAPLRMRYSKEEK